MRRLTLTLVLAWSTAGASFDVPASATFKVATWNVRSGMGMRGFGTRDWRHDTLNCGDRTKPLNAWGLGLPQRELHRIKDDPAIVALAVQEAWNCGSPGNLNSVLRFTSATRERNGVALLARHGFAGKQIEHRIGVPGAYDAWIVGGRVCLDAACSAAMAVFSSHWGATHEREWPVQAQNVVTILRSEGRHVFAGDLNVFKVDRWNPKVPCTSGDSASRTRAIEIIEHAGYVDAWKATHDGEGWTGMTNRSGCGTPEGNLYKRIDYIYTRDLRVVSTARFARTAPGSDAPSDHAGLIAELTLP